MTTSAILAKTLRIGGMNFIVIAMQIEQAISIVKAAGYRVTKPKPKAKTRVGPTFVARFADGQVTRMSTFTSLDKLDYGRGVRLPQRTLGGACVSTSHSLLRGHCALGASKSRRRAKPARARGAARHPHRR
jgi:hypothetical protein